MKRDVMMRIMFRALVIFGIASLAARAFADEFTFAPTAALTPRALAEVVRMHSARTTVALLATDLAMAEARGARLFGNPLIDFSWNTIPVGGTNPPHQVSPLSRIPNYSVGVSYVFDFLHRGPRVQRAEALVRASRADVEGAMLDDTWALAKTLGRIAVASIKRRAAVEMRVDAEHATEITKSREHAGAGSLLDVDRMQNELLRVELQVTAADSELELAHADCAAIIGMTCADFPSTDEAEHYLAAWMDAALAQTGELDARADLKSLAAQADAAAEELRVANRIAIPDVTARLGYTRDQYSEAGNQVNSLNVGVSVPLPIASNGQAERQAASARVRRLGEQRGRVLQQSLARIPSQRRALTLGQARGKRLAEEMIPRARTVLTALQKASESRLLPITDVLQASRALNEILLDQAANEGATFESAVELLAQYPMRW